MSKPPNAPVPQRGRPVVLTKAWSKITLVLLDQQIAFLDRAAIDIRLRHGRAISRAEIVRALVQAIEDSGVDLTEAADVEGIAALLGSRLRKR